MRLGLRLQILVLLGALLLLGFVPLYIAVATYTTVALQQIRVSHARALGRAVAAHVGEALDTRSAAELATLLQAEIGSEGVAALVAYDRDGRRLAAAGVLHNEAALRAALDPTREVSLEIGSAAQRELAVSVPARAGAVLALLRIDDQSARAAPLLRLLGLYTTVAGASLLLVAYFALTRWIVRPLDELSSAAVRVAGGARRFQLPVTRAHELVDLGLSLRSMTERLLSEEEALRKKIDEVEAATRDLAAAQENLVRSERLASVGRLAAGLAHEIGNPLAALIGLQDLLLTGQLEPNEQHDFLVRMRNETERIHRILRDLLAFSRPSTTGNDPHEPGDLARAIHDTVNLVAPQREMHGIELKLDLAPDLPPVALGNERLMQVLLNLVLNAADAVPRGGHIVVAARPSNREVELTVSDDGPGVAEAIQARLFEPFATTKDPGKGTGLGLAVCRGLVESVGGSIRLDSRHRPGARFIVALPLA